MFVISFDLWTEALWACICAMVMQRDSLSQSRRRIGIFCRVNRDRLQKSPSCRVAFAKMKRNITKVYISLPTGIKKTWMDLMDDKHSQNNITYKRIEKKSFSRRFLCWLDKMAREITLEIVKKSKQNSDILI